ncbi:Slp family lipoprotein [Metallibacterium sp.]|uniref:Slp family lipoprotein n=1 Tax=Metallibacterium sp. TaxID=2940281 RepID=UPI0026098A58|nr:Slp family lipoprotein [Metallibacterium sp.]
MNTRVLKPLAMALGTVLLASCATVPKNLAGSYAEITPQQASNGNVSGTSVRWGGQIIQTEPGHQDTCFYVLGKPLASGDARPEMSRDSTGRFVACKRGFYDPEVYAKGREITVVGVLQGVVTRKVGDFDYPYPRVVANAVHLWPVPVVYRRGYYGGYGGWNDPFWGGPGWWGPWGGWGGGWGYSPFGYAPAVVVGPDDDDPPPPPPPPPPPKG